MPRTEVVFYRDDDGSVPVLEWLDALPLKARLKCLVRLERLRQLGHELRRPEADFLRDGIHELRISLEHVQYRLLYGLHTEAEAEVDQDARRKVTETRPAKKGTATKKHRKTPFVRRTIAVVAHAITKEDSVPEEEINRAVRRMNKFQSNPGRHTYTYAEE